ncbi:receptor-like serine/threonine-protein kinase SD1-8 [Phalaenopsis equestris]|uniref:receptor-like serine/threonine-protein kinase SD1-8 n=1 Tax=Phalaenopsis equestris TaxID=78828 RepID=UPI0009E1916D|nr:receptor-like serine/threonine-protein kinase SD1-8 [Phalaenopsis equestris]
MALSRWETMTQQFLPTLLFFLTFFPSISFSTDTITPSRFLSDGETLISSNGTFALGFFTPPKTTNRYLGIWYHKLASPTVVWVANRRNPISNSNATLSIRAGDASLHLVASDDSTPLWSSPSINNSIPDPIAQLLDNGNFVVKSPNSSSILWQSFDHPTDIMLPGMKIGPNLKTGVDRNLVAWRSLSDPSPGTYTLAIDPVGVPQFVIRDVSGNWIWRGGPWNGFGFSGAGSNQFFDIGLYREFISSFNTSSDEIYYQFNMVGDAISILTMDQNGSTSRYGWEASSQNWSLYWFAPNDTCDFFSTCGINAICDTSSSPICRCIDGFNPANTASWRRGDWSDGCVRTANLGCEANGTDEFMVVRGSKLPDTKAAVADMSLDIDGCKARCLMNCSCKAYASADLSRGGNGCYIWMAEIKDLKVYADGGQDLYVRVAPSGEGSKNKAWVYAITAVAIALFLLIILICVFMIRRRKLRKLLEEQSISSLNWEDEIVHKGKEGNSTISLFKFTQIVSATDNFSNFNKLGEGGFGPVYKGKLPEGQDVAVKRLSTRSGQGLEEFKNEILLIAKLQHMNLVRLLGCCIHGEEKMLIYEFMPNKSLDLFLFDASQRSRLDWRRRFQIIEGITQGLLYLHKHSRLKIIHRDLKASNILLDADMNPKISDFGMARIFDANETQANTRRIVGTYGYMSPEYAFKGLFSVKSDVFSFGVLLLEILSGKRNAGFHDFGSSYNLLAYAWELWKEGKWMEFVDPALDNQFGHEVTRCIYVALLCVQESPEDRPIMSDVATMLSSVSLQFGSVKQPAFFSMKDASDSKLPLNMHVNSSSNELSVTLVSGR